MLVELGGKGGCLCEPARLGAQRCPLIVRPTSEDAVTGQIFGTLRAINPRWWLPHLLNQGLKTDYYRQQIFREFRIELWQKQPTFPKHLIPWDEGTTEVDVVLSWENPATTIFIEMKYGSPLSATTVHNNGHKGFPSDQLIRNARLGLYRFGYYHEEALFSKGQRDFALLLMTPYGGNELVERYSHREELLRAIPHGEKLLSLPSHPFIGERSYSDLIQTLKFHQKFMSKAENTLVNQLTEYLNFKISSLSKTAPPQPQ